MSMHFVESLISPTRLMTRTKNRTGISSSERCMFSIFGFLIDLAVHSEISTALQVYAWRQQEQLRTLSASRAKVITTAQRISVGSCRASCSRCSDHCSRSPASGDTRSCAPPAPHH